MGKKYIIVEKSENVVAVVIALLAALAVAFVAVLLVLHLVLSFAHYLLFAVLGYCGFLICRHIFRTDQYEWPIKTAVYLFAILLLGGFGFYFGEKIRDSYLESKTAKNAKTASEKEPAKAASPLAVQKTENSQKNTEKAAPPAVAEKVRPTEPSLTEKSSDKMPIQADHQTSPASPLKSEVPLSLNDALSDQELAIEQKVSGVLDLLEQLKQHLESGEAVSKDDIRSRLQAISETAIRGGGQLKTSSELSKLRAVLGRLEKEFRQNTRLSATARLKTQELLLKKEQELERIEKLNVVSIEKLSAYGDSCDRWLSDFDTLWKIDGLQPASKQLLNDLSKLQELKNSNRPKALVQIFKMPSPVAGSLLTFQLAPEVSQSFCAIPSGNFIMGSPISEDGRFSDESQVQVSLSQPFWLAKTEVTQAQWEAVMGSNPSDFKGEQLPVECVSWDDAQAFITKLNHRKILSAGWRFALPTEAQWEYACRAGGKGPYFEASLNEVGWYRDNSADKTHKVGQKKANVWGLQDMHGNVYEWCSDWYDVTMKGGVNPKGPDSGDLRVRRGGSWFDLASLCRSALRFRLTPNTRGNRLGFRPALVPSR